MTDIGTVVSKARVPYVPISVVWYEASMQERIQDFIEGEDTTCVCKYFDRANKNNEPRTCMVAFGSWQHFVG